MSPDLVESFKGEILIASLPYVQIIAEEHRYKRCSYCFKLKSGITCSICGSIIFCNPECQSNDSDHALECQYMNASVLLSEISRLLLRLILRENLVENNCAKLEELNGFSKIDTITEVEIKESYESLVHIIPENLDSFESFKEKFGQVQLNCFSVFGDVDEKVGLSLYLTPFPIKHSCVPNSELFFSNNELKIKSKTNYRHKDLTKLTISYIDRTLKHSERQDHIKKMSGNDCDCKKCIEFMELKGRLIRRIDEMKNPLLTKCYMEEVEKFTEGKNRHYFWSLRCPNCHGWPISVGCQNEALKCVYCEENVEDEVVGKYFRVKSEFLKTELITLDVAVKHLYSMFSVLHPYDICFIALCQISLFEYLAKNKEEEALDVANFLYGVISHLIPKSDSQKELEILVEILTKMKNK